MQEPQNKLQFSTSVGGAIVNGKSNLAAAISISGSHAGL
jgi:hypothetical protein